MKICTKCNEPKQATKQFFYVHRNGKLRNECIKCVSERSAFNYSLRQERKRKVKEQLPEWIDRPKVTIVVDVQERQKVIPNYPQSKSEYHKVIEQLNHNPKFFSWLCAGTNQNFIP